MKQAFIDDLQRYLDTKTVHSLKSLSEVIIRLGSDHYSGFDVLEQQEFGEFHKAFQENSERFHRNSWGRGQFRDWMENYLITHQGTEVKVFEPDPTEGLLEGNTLVTSLVDDTPPWDTAEDGVTTRIPMNDGKFVFRMGDPMPDQEQERRIPKFQDIAFQKDGYYCELCNEHITQCVCGGTSLNGVLNILVKGEGYSITRGRAMLLRAVGLRWFNRFIDSYIQNQQVRDWATRAMVNAPLYFWATPSSSGGKYHCKHTDGIFGLPKHVLFVAYMANELSRTFCLDKTTHDLTLASAFIHDNIKFGIDYDPRYFEFHMVGLRSYYGKWQKNILKYLPENWAEVILKGVETHQGSMAGEWTVTKGIAPTTPSQMVVHLADYTASRKQAFWAVWEEIDNDIEHLL